MPALTKDTNTEDEALISPIQPSPKNAYRPICSDISEDNQSDMEKLNSPKIVEQPKPPPLPKALKSPPNLPNMKCSVRVKKLPGEYSAISAITSILDFTLLHYVQKLIFNSRLFLMTKQISLQINSSCNIK